MSEQPASTPILYVDRGTERPVEYTTAAPGTSKTYVHGVYVDEIVAMQTSLPVPRTDDPDGFAMAVIGDASATVDDLAVWLNGFAACQAGLAPPCPEEGSVARFLQGLAQPQSVGTTYFHQDDLYSTRLLTNVLGQVTDRYAYDPYGRSYHLVGSSAEARLFTGRNKDAETGLYYYRSRYYSPEQGRFVNRDTIGTWGDAMNLGNAYGYAGSRPHMGLDPSGKYTCLDMKPDCKPEEYQCLNGCYSESECWQFKFFWRGGACSKTDPCLDDYYKARNEKECPAPASPAAPPAVEVMGTNMVMVEGIAGINPAAPFDIVNPTKAIFTGVVCGVRALFTGNCAPTEGMCGNEDGQKAIRKSDGSWRDPGPLSDLDQACWKHDKCVTEASESASPANKIKSGFDTVTTRDSGVQACNAQLSLEATMASCMSEEDLWEWIKCEYYDRQAVAAYGATATVYNGRP